MLYRTTGAGSIDAGFAGTLERPYTQDDLRRVLGPHLARPEGSTKSRTLLHSSLASTSAGRQVIVSYVAWARQIGTELRHRASRADVAGSLTICEAIRESGGSAGFAELSTCAHEAARAIAASCSTEEAAREIVSLMTAIERLSDQPLEHAA
jgi:hypothetical protein